MAGTPPLPRSPMSPPKAEGGPKIFKLTSSWRRRGRSTSLAVSLKHWKGRRGGGEWGLGGGGLLLRCTAVLIHHRGTATRGRRWQEEAQTHGRGDEQGTERGGRSVPSLVGRSVQTQTCPNTALGAFPQRRGRGDRNTRDGGAQPPQTNTRCGITDPRGGRPAGDTPSADRGSAGAEGTTGRSERRALHSNGRAWADTRTAAGVRIRNGHGTSVDLHRRVVAMRCRTTKLESAFTPTGTAMRHTHAHTRAPVRAHARTHRRTRTRPMIPSPDVSPKTSRSIYNPPTGHNARWRRAALYSSTEQRFAGRLHSSFVGAHDNERGCHSGSTRGHEGRRVGENQGTRRVEIHANYAIRPGATRGYIRVGSACLSGRFRTARVQRAHSANYYGDYPGNNPENHAPAESCTINSKLKNSNI